MKRRWFLTAACTLVLGLAGTVQAKPNFSGDWKLNVEKSDFGPVPAPDSLTMKIDHADPDLKIAAAQVGGSQGDMNYEVKYTTDGKETTNTIGATEFKSTATWDGAELAILSKLDLNGAEIGFKSRWALSEDGKVLTQLVHITSPQGELDIKQVLDKQTKE